MATTVRQMASIISVFGVVCFLLGVIAVHKKPKAGTPIPSEHGVTCKYPADPSIALGYLSTAFLIACAITGYLSLFYPYKGKFVPKGAVFKYTAFTVNFSIALLTTGLAAAMLLWPTITEQVHLTCNVHSDVNYKCPTANTNLLVVGALLSLISTLYWLLSLKLVNIAQEDFLKEQVDKKGEFDNTSLDTYDAVWLHLWESQQAFCWFKGENVS